MKRDPSPDDRDMETETVTPRFAVVKIDGVQSRDADTYYFRWSDANWQSFLELYLDGFEPETHKPVSVSVVLMTETEFEDIVDSGCGGTSD